MLRPLRVAAPTLLVALAVAGCGSSGSDNTAGGDLPPTGVGTATTGPTTAPSGAPFVEGPGTGAREDASIRGNARKRAARSAIADYFAARRSGARTCDRVADNVLVAQTKAKGARGRSACRRAPAQAANPALPDPRSMVVTSLTIDGSRARASVTGSDGRYRVLLSRSGSRWLIAGASKSAA